MAQDRNTRERLAQAKALVKKGQYQKARYVLQDIKSDPTARKLLKQMDGRKDKLQGGLSYFYSGTLLVMIALGIVFLVVFFNVFDNFQADLQGNDDINQVFRDREIPGSQEVFLDLVRFCTDRVGESSDSCFDWSELVMRDYMTDVSLCVINTEEGFQYRNQTTDDVAACFIERGIPDPTVPITAE